MQLALLLDEAQQAPLDRRIQLRDPIAAFGPRAIEAVQPWLASPSMAAFAVRVIERAGESGEAVLAAQALRAARAKAGPSIREDIDWALARLKPVRAAAHAEPGKPAPTRPTTREQPLFSNVPRRHVR